MRPLSLIVAIIISYEEKKVIHANTLSIKLVEVINQLQNIAKDNAAQS
jgi:hypothetical protein